MATKQQIVEPDDGPEWPKFEFSNVVRLIMIEEIRAMIRRLQGSGSFELPKEVVLDELDSKTAKYIRDQLRDTLRTLGGGR